MSKGGFVNNSRYRRESRSKSVKERTEFRATLTNAQQLKRLDERLGANVGAKSERARLTAEVVAVAEASTNKVSKNRKSPRASQEVTDDGVA